VSRYLTASGPGLRANRLASERDSGLRHGQLLRLALPCHAGARGRDGLGLPEKADTADRSDDCHLGSAQNQHSLGEFPHFLLLIEDAPSLLPRRTFRNSSSLLLWASGQYVLDKRRDQCFYDVSSIFRQQICQRETQG
jgi:hypothetical protein